MRKPVLFTVFILGFLAVGFLSLLFIAEAFPLRLLGATSGSLAALVAIIIYKGSPPKV